MPEPLAPPARPTTGERTAFAAFLQSARVEVARYGDDDDVFVRELVQNARDAGAKNIRFFRGETAADETVSVDDDGSGMTREIVSSALLRLFSSQKDREEGAAGCFGVGFWSVLRFADLEIVVDTHTGRVGCALCIDLKNGSGTETLTEVKGLRTTRGTTVTLRRRRRATPFALRDAVLHHASLVSGKGGPPPRLDLSGEVLNRSLKLRDDVLASRPIGGKGFRGVVGISVAPRIELFHHGLRVVEATSLMALVPSKKHTALRGLGLSAQIDVDALTVLVDRKTVVEDDRLRAVVDACDSAARVIEREALDESAPLPLVDHLLQLLRRVAASKPLRLAGFGFATVLVGAVLGFGALWMLRPDLRGRMPLAGAPSTWASSSAPTAARPTAPVAKPLDNALLGFDAPRIDVRGQSPGGWDVDVRGVGTAQLRLFALPFPDERRGLTARPLRVHAVTADAGGSEDASAVLAFAVARTGPVILPSSSTWQPVRVSEAGSSPVPVVFADDDGLPVHLTTAAGVLTVELRRVSTTEAATLGEAPPEAVVPASSQALRELVAVTRALPRAARIDSLVVEVQRRVAYSADAASAARFDADHRDFVDKALAIGRGDCDVINAVLVRALQAVGEDARLAVGLIVVDDVVAEDLHAWAEVRGDDGRWQILDASPPEARPRPASKAASAAAKPTTTTTAPPKSTAARNLAFAAGGAGVLSVLILGVLWQLRRRRRRPRANVLPLFLAGLQSGAAERLGLRQRPFLPTVDDDLLTLDECQRLFAAGHLARGKERPAWLSKRVAVLDEADERVRALLPWLPPALHIDDLRFDDAVVDALAELQAAINRCFVGVAVRASDAIDDVRELHLRGQSGATHLVLVPRRWLDDVDAATARIKATATCLRGMP